MRRVSSVAVLWLAACGASAARELTDSTVAGDAVPDAGPCGVRAGQRGLTKRALHVAGLDRTYLVYLPPNDDPSRPVPLVFVHHGFTMAGQDMYEVTHYPALADSEHIALAFPDGQGGPSDPPWNVGSNPCWTYAGPPPNAAGDDFAFLDAMQADIAQDQCLDVSHVYVTGFSMGAYFSHHAGCMKPGIRAIAPHSGGAHALDACVNGHVPVIIFHGLADPLVPDGCDDPSATTPAGFVASATEWAQKNGCAMTTHSISVANGTCAIYDGCPADGQVELCTFTAMGHCWAGGVLSLFGCPDYASATQLEWDFFKQHAW
jgi:poly(3-hydroxybutyrate) depolymerase